MSFVFVYNNYLYYLADSHILISQFCGVLLVSTHLSSQHQ